MKIELDIKKDLHTNANDYFSKAKRLKAKLPGLEKAMEKTKEEIANFEKRKEEYLKTKEKEEKIKTHVKKQWYEKFRFTHTSKGTLFVIGKDATSNEALLKKHLEENDVVFHTEAAGSPFGILKGAGKEPSETEQLEAGTFLACFSRQWQSGYGSADVFWVLPEQVTKEAMSGEFLSKGSFMIYGKKNILKNVPLRIAIGTYEKKVKAGDEEITIKETFSGSETAAARICRKFVRMEPGQAGYKELNKELKKRLGATIEDLPKYIPDKGRILKN